MRTDPSSQPLYTSAEGNTPVVSVTLMSACESASVLCIPRCAALRRVWRVRCPESREDGRKETYLFCSSVYI